MLSMMPDLSKLDLSVANPELRDHVERVCRDLGGLPGDVQVMPVKQVRDAFKQVRERLHSGGVTLIADRGELGDASETTVMVSLQTLQRMFIEAIEKSAEIQATHEKASDILSGLPRLPAASADFQVDFSSAASLPAATIKPFVKL